VSALVAVDGGQSGLRMSVVQDGVPGRAVEAAGYDHGDGVLGIATAVADARRALELDAPVVRACLGLTGAPATQALRARLAALVSDRLDGAAIALGPDMVTAHAGALGGDPGVVVAAGTGAVAFGVAADGTTQRADGLGFLLGDDGSGFAIGRAGIRAALRAREGRGPATALVEAADAFFGGLDDLAHRVYTSGAPVAALAAFAPAVADVARAGDRVARDIWSDAADALVATAVSVVRRTFPAGADGIAVSHTGRLFGVGDLLLAPFTARLAERCPEARHRTPLGDSLAGAARLVQRGLGPYRTLMHTTPGWDA
jgi:N-acetylglucosamine kinase-like BadF-type ATPase